MAKARTGPTTFVMSDAAGNLATSAFGLGDIAALDGRAGRLERNVKEAYQGTAIALGGAVLPEGKNYAISAGFGAYHGQTAFGASAVLRFTDNISARAASRSARTAAAMSMAAAASPTPGETHSAEIAAKMRDFLRRQGV